MGEEQTQKRKFSDILEKIKVNPECGLKIFYENYGKIIKVTAKTVCLSPDIVNSVINGVLIKVWRFSACPKEIENPEGWVYTVTLNTAKDTLKEKRTVGLLDNYPDPKDGIGELLGADAFACMISRLSEKEQRVMIAKFIEKQTFKEIAKELGKKINTVSAIYYRALEKIKKSLEEENEI